MFGVCGVFVTAFECFIKIILPIVGLVMAVFCYACCKVSAYRSREEELREFERLDGKR